MYHWAQLGVTRVTRVFLDCPCRGAGV